MEQFLNYDYKMHPANIGIDYSFQGFISEKVLRNYLARAVTFANETEESVNLESTEYIRFILNVGAKFIGRLTSPWVVSEDEVSTHKGQKEFISLLHKYDPEIICEACIFENVTKQINSIQIPEYVFEAFGIPIEKRNFSYEKMLFPNKKYLNVFGDGSTPDITNRETQMYFYWRACNFIDLGYEALHMGQVHWMSERDSKFSCFSKVFKMVRAYAKKNARRKMVLINAHTLGMYDENGNLLFDFNEWPMRGVEPEGSVPHTPEEYPQEMILAVNDWEASDWRSCIFTKSKGGRTPSGWACESLPYLFELDNAGPPQIDKKDKPGFKSESCWGYDDISWFANQQDEYRREWLNYAVDWICENDPNGYFELPARRTAFVTSYRNTYKYYAGRNDFGDEETIKEIFKNLREKRNKFIIKAALKD